MDLIEKRRRNDPLISIVMRKIIPGDVLILLGELQEVLEARPFVNGQDGFSKRPRIFLKLKNRRTNVITTYNNYRNFVVVRGNSNFRYKD